MPEPKSWGALSEELADLVERAAPWVVMVDGRRRAPGTGFHFAADGTVVTASHAVEREEEIEVGLDGGETVPARLVGRDPATDLAVLRLERGGFPAADWSDAPPRTGQLALCISRPGRAPRASLGLLSRVGPAWRTPAGGKVERYLELGIGMGPGFSGSLLLDLSGRALGLAAGGLLRGAALALPAPTLHRIVKSILAHGGLRRGFLGVATLPIHLPPPLEQGAGQSAAVLLTAVEPGSPAERAGLLLGDALLAVEGRPVSHSGDLLPYLEEERIGEPLSVRLWRAGALRELRVVVGARGDGGGRS